MKSRHIQFGAWSILRITALLLLSYALAAYLILPQIWRHYEHNRTLEEAPKVTVTAEGINGDPINIGFFGTKQELIQALLSAGWYPADPVTLRTSLRLAKSVLLRRPYPTAPVSYLYLWGRRQDIAFQKPVGKSAKQRHHVRLWCSKDLGKDKRPLWIGAATFDRSIGVSRWTGKITHHIAPGVDAERDALLDDLVRAGQVLQVYQVTGVGMTLMGKNGGGDWYYTDGEVSIAELSRNNEVKSMPPEVLRNSITVDLKNYALSWMRGFVLYCEQLAD